MADTIENETVTETTNKEPIKNEESTTSTSNNDERNDGANSPPPNCSICLGKLINTSFTDSCLHQFCFTCLLQWSRIKTECPLCKQTFKSIIHNVRSEEDYDQYHVPRGLAQPSPASQMTAAIEVNFAVTRASRDVRRFAYRTTMFPRGRFELLLNPDQMQRQQPIPNALPPLSREERRNRRSNPMTFRRNIYRTGEWSNLVPDAYSRFRECTADYYQRNPQELDRLIPWINRELLTLLNANQPHIAYVLRIIMDSITRYDMRSPEFHDILRPYFNVHTHHFIHELMNFCRSALSVADYDAYVIYSPHIPSQGLSGEYWNFVQSPISSINSNSSSSNDSDVRVVDHVDNIEIPNIEIPGLSSSYSEFSMPGPSTVGETFNVHNTTGNNNNLSGTSGGSTRLPCVTIMSSSSSDSDECEIVGYVKPRHERTPEIIELVSSDDEGIDTNDVDENSISLPKTPPIILSNDEAPCTSNANNNQRPKTNYSKLSDVSVPISSSSVTVSDSDSDSEFIVRPPQKRNSRSNTKRGGADGKKIIERKCTKKSSRKRNKSSTSDSFEIKKTNKRQKNSKTMSRKSEKNTSVIISSSSGSDNENNDTRRKLKVQKNMMNERKKMSRSNSSSSSSSTSTTTSTSSDQTSSDSSHVTSSGLSYYYRGNRNNTKSKQKNKSTHKKLDNSNDNHKLEQSKLKSFGVKSRGVNLTLLRKDVNKKEWYIDTNNKKSRSRSRSRSSCESSYDNNSSRRYSRHRDRRSRSNSPIGNRRERRLALKVASERLKNKILYSSDDSQSDDNDTQHNYERSNSQSSTMSDKYSHSTRKDKNNMKYSNSRRKKYNNASINENNDEQFVCVASTSTATEKYCDSKNNTRENKSSNSAKNSTDKKLDRKINKDTMQMSSSSSSKPKSKLDKQHRDYSFYSSTSTSSSSSMSSSSSSD